ncbi:MAG: hypothetical protein LDL41_18130, partial [Coleofasciculus sp. S288]|nr:hypothetical protein [Coleofasciculus sp. S288]
MLNSSDNPPEQRYHLRLLQQLIDNHPIVFWSGVWTTVVVAGSVAAFNLLNPGPIEPEASVPS